MVSTIYWDPSPVVFSVPYFDFPILWYGVFFALGFWLAFLVFVKILSRYSHLEPSKVKEIADRLTVYIVVGTILGARLGHFLFYESPSDYLTNPLEFFKLRNGGLASHGAVIGIILAVILFSYRIRKKHPDLTWIRLLDFISVPTALAGAFIRIGNFFNQEIMGTPSNLPWAVLFGHPADGSFPVPRHPAQLYEAIWYLVLFFLLWRLSKRPSLLRREGRLVGLFLILAFLFRFFVEFIKTEQSHLLDTSWLTMGQILSIPAILLGFFFYLKRP
jgi:prolipoprotein diacylglyceryl transferase